MAKYILIVNNMGDSSRPFRSLGLPVTEDLRLLKTKPESIALAVFCGGADVSPGLYGHKNICSSTNYHRDQVEVTVFNLCVQNNIPMAGICRGAQFACAMVGGALVQDITGHGGSEHLIVDREGSEVLVNSCHHQMQYPWNLPEDAYEVLAWCPTPHSKHYILDPFGKIPAEEADEKLRMEIDCVLYKRAKDGTPITFLGMQYHPEWMNYSSAGFKYAEKLVETYLRPAIFGLRGADSVSAKTAG